MQQKLSAHLKKKTIIIGIQYLVVHQSIQELAFEAKSGLSGEIRCALALTGPISLQRSLVETQTPSPK